MKTNKIIYWAATGLLSALLLMNVGMYIFNNEMVREVFTNLGYPIYIIYPLAVAKLGASIVLLTQKNNKLKEWAYAGLFFDFILAASAHLAIGDGDHLPALIAIIVLFISYIFGNKIYQTS